MGKAMRRIYHPDSWSIIKLEYPEGKVEYLVFGAWTGNFSTPDKWRLSSGSKSLTTKVNKEGVYSIATSQR
ncbi:hypothetical protein VcTj87_01150 [Vibrio comitans]